MIISFRLFCGVVQLRCSRSISQPSGDFQYYPHSSLVEICNDFIMRQPSAHEMGAAFWSSCLPKRREPFSGLGKVLKSREASGTNKFWRSISSSLISNMFPSLFVLFMTFCERLGGGRGDLLGSFFSLASQSFCVSNEIHKRPLLESTPVFSFYLHHLGICQLQAHSLEGSNVALL